MVSKWANPSCDNSFRYLRGGKLFLVEPPPFRPGGKMQFQEVSCQSEYFWLCGPCALKLTITADGDGHTVLTSRTGIHLGPY